MNGPPPPPHSLRVAVVGAGPAGIYTAEALATQDRVPVVVDVLDRMPTPYGLVRYGVAPDHPRIKSVVTTLQEILQLASVRFLGELEVGGNVTTDELLQHYDAVVYATGACVDQKLAIPGEELPGSYAATDFVSWYSGHPDAVQPFSLDVRSVAVVGVGNVAVDVARMLTKRPEDLAATDLPVPVIKALRASTVQEVFLLGRRGPEHAKFTSKELRELGELDDVDVRLNSADLDVRDTDVPRAAQPNLRMLRSWVGKEAAAAPRQLNLRFWSRPLRVLGKGRVEALRVERTYLDEQNRLRGSGDVEDLPVQLVLRAVGYRSVPVKGVPFDKVRGVVPHLDGRVLDPAGQIRPGEYVAGWLKRGPSGVIGTNRLCAVETVNQLLEDLCSPGSHRRSLDSPLEELLATRHSPPSTWAGWLAIDAAEQERGQAGGRDREKIADWPTLRELSRGARPEG